MVCSAHLPDSSSAPCSLLRHRSPCGVYACCAPPYLQSGWHSTCRPGAPAAAPAGMLPPLHRPARAAARAAASGALAGAAAEQAAARVGAGQLRGRQGRRGSLLAGRRMPSLRSRCRQEAGSVHCGRTARCRPPCCSGALQVRCWRCRRCCCCCFHLSKAPYGLCPSATCFAHLPCLCCLPAAHLPSAWPGLCCPLYCRQEGVLDGLQLCWERRLHVQGEELERQHMEGSCWQFIDSFPRNCCHWLARRRLLPAVAAPNTVGRWVLGCPLCPPTRSRLNQPCT